jgi:hypothetical protein
MAQHFLSYALSVFGSITGTEYAAKHRKCIRMKVLEPLRVVSIEHKLVLPDDGPCGPKHVGVILMYSLF